jgi:phenylacetate-CoA ligase
MVDSFVRCVVYPLHEAVNGRPTMRAWRMLTRSQHWLPADLDALQLEKLRALLSHAEQRVPWYTERFCRAGRSSRDVKSPHELGLLPVLDRADVRNHTDAFIARGLEHLLRRSSTSGSTGSPVRFWIDPVRAAFNQAARLRAHAWFDVRPGDRGVYVWGGPLRQTLANRVRQMRDRLLNEWMRNAYDFTPQRMADCLRAITRIRPAYIYGFAGAICQLAEFARDENIAIRGAVDRAVFTTGEVLRPEWRSLIESVFGSVVADEYGCREVDVLAHQCPAGSYHLMAENVIVEIVDADGRPVAPGETGDVVVTNLNGYAMPFIRYRTGDVAAFETGRCTCGLALPLIRQPSGRRVDFLRATDGRRISGQSVTRDILDVPGIRDYRIQQERADLVRVVLVGDASFRPHGPARLATVIRGRLGETMAVEVDEVSRLTPHPSGKHHYVMNLIPEHDSSLV